MVNKEERLEDLKKIIETKGFISLNKTNLAKKYNVSRTTIYNDIQEIANEIDPNDIKVQKLIIRSSMDFALKETFRIINSTNDFKIRLIGTDLLSKITERYYNILNLKEESKNVINNNDLNNIKVDIVHSVHDIKNMDEKTWKDVCEQRKRKIIENG